VLPSKVLLVAELYRYEDGGSRGERRSQFKRPEVIRMPYIEEKDRKRLDGGGNPETPGELNYAITRLVDEYLMRKGEMRYAYLNEVLGAMECAKLELYRRVAAPYEDQKIAEHGDVYVSPGRRE